VGHLWLAETARAQLGLDRVVFLPAGEPPHKQERTITAVSHRVAMLTIALTETTGFEVSRRDADRPPPHTTVTLLPLLREDYADADFWWLIGGDSLRDLHTWVAPERIIRQCRLGVLPRPGSRVDWERVQAQVRGVETAVDWLDGPTLHLSGTEIREWARQGYAVSPLTPPAVAAYITDHALYAQRQA
jgi:nicotinate-nucleotide adenylyltransferase